MRYQLRNINLQDMLARRTKREERSKLDRAQIQRQEVLQSLGTLSDGIANEVLSFLQAIQTNAELIEHTAQDPRIKELAERITEGVHYINIPINSLRLFSGNMPHTNQVYALNDIVQRIYTPLKNKFNSNVTAQFIPSPEPVHVYADQFYLAHVVASLISNANEAMPNGGQLLVAIHEKSISQDCAVAKHIKPGQYVVLTVSDTGTGIAQDEIEHIFEPYFSRKEERGHGLSLSVVHGIVKKNNGFIELNSRLGEGTTFKAYLPSAQPLDNLLNHTPLEYFATRKKVLIVDDEEILRESLKEQLEVFFDREVATAADGVYGLEYLQKNRPDLMITDLTMPRMHGEELCAAARKLYPTLPIMIMSGNIAKDTKYPHPILAKPFNKTTLQERMMDAIGQVYRENRR